MAQRRDSRAESARPVTAFTGSDGDRYSVWVKQLEERLHFKLSESFPALVRSSHNRRSLARLLVLVQYTVTGAGRDTGTLIIITGMNDPGPARRQFSRATEAY